MTDLKKNRLEKGYTQEEVARLLHVSVNTVRLWDRGAGKPSADNREAIERLFGRAVRFGGDE